jgi:uncharacterized protein DUF3631
MGDREGDISVPLLTIADHAGPAWADRGRRPLLALFGMQAAEGRSAEAAMLLLADMLTIFDEKGGERFSRAAIAVRAVIA